jgi:DNA polymerase-4
MLETDLLALVDRLAPRLRAAHRVARTVTLRLRFDDFSRATRSHSLQQATGETSTLLDVARTLLSEALPMIRERGVTLIGLTFGSLSNDDAVQLALSFEGWDSAAIDATLDRLRDRFGSSVVTRGALLGPAEGLRVPLLPD